MNIEPSHRARAEDALARAQRNPVMSAEQSFLIAQVHALLALERRLEEIVIALRNAPSATTVPADDGWPDGEMHDHGTGLEVAR